MANWWDSDPVAQPQAQAVEWWKNDPVSPQEQAEADVRAGKDPDYRQSNSFLPASFQRLSDQVMDPFGVQDEMVGAGQFIRSLVTGNKGLVNPETWSNASKAYSDAAERVRAERRVAREDNSILPEIVGGFGTAGVSRVAPAVQGFWNSARQAAKVGAGYGAATGFAQGEGGVTERGLEAAKGAAIGAVAAPVVSHVVVPAVARTYGAVRDAVRYGQQAVQSARNPQQAAIDNVADRMVGAGVDPAAVRAQISPAPSAQLAQRINPATGQNFNEADMADIVSRSMRGETAAAIGQQYGLSPSTVNRYVAGYREANPTPLNIMDISKEVAGEGGSAPVTRLGRAAYSLAGDESGEAAQRLVSRQETQPGRVSNIIQRSAAGGDFEATQAAGLASLRNEANTAYRRFYAEPELATSELADLMADPLFRRANIQAQRQARVEIIRRNQQAARNGRPQEPVPNVDPNNQVFSPEHLDLIQRQLRIASEGAVSNPNAARHARNLREVFLDRIEDHYPTFQGIRRDYATRMGEFGEEGALEAGANLTTKLGAPSREALREFDQMTPAQQELFRLGFARRLMDMAANPKDGSGVANQFNSPAVREIIQRLYPQADRNLAQQGHRLVRDLRREATTTRTKNDVMVGARTAELGSDMGRLMEGAQTAADVATGRWGKLLENLSTRLSTQLGRRGAQEVLRALTETDPAQLLPLLNRLALSAQNTQQRQAYVTAMRQLRAANLPGVSMATGQSSGRPSRQ